MGQLITVTPRRSRRPDVAVFELNRSLTGMGHERYQSPAEVTGWRPVDELARRLFAAGGVKAVHVYSNVVTANVSEAADVDGLAEVIRHLFIHYGDDRQPEQASTEAPATSAG